jgi:hypothetical protein
LLAGSGGAAVSVVVLAAKAAVAVLLLVSGGSKLPDLSGFAATIGLFAPARAPARVLAAAHRAAVVIAAAELVTGAVSLCWPGVAWVNPVVLALSCSFVLVAAVGYARHRGRPCHCFGALTKRGFGLPSLLRTLVIMMAAAAACAGVRPAPLLHFALAFHLLLLAAAVLMATAAAAAAKALLTQSASTRAAAA